MQYPQNIQNRDPDQNKCLNILISETRTTSPTGIEPIILCANKTLNRERIGIESGPAVLTRFRWAVWIRQVLIFKLDLDISLLSFHTSILIPDHQENRGNAGRGVVSGKVFAIHFYVDP